MVKFVLFSLSLLSMLIVLGDSIESKCIFGLATFTPLTQLPETSRPTVALYCDADSVAEAKPIIDQCTEANVTVELKFVYHQVDKNFKMDVNCLKENKGVDIILTQSGDDAAYDVLQFVPSPGEESRTLVILSKLLSKHEDTTVKESRDNGLWMKTDGTLHIHMIEASEPEQGKKSEERLLQSWTFRFEPKKAPRNQTTIVVLHKTGTIVTSPVPLDYVQQPFIEVPITARGGAAGGFELAMVLLEDDTEMLFEPIPGSRDPFSFRKKQEFEVMYTNPVPQAKEKGRINRSPRSGRSRRSSKSRSASGSLSPSGSPRRT